MALAVIQSQYLATMDINPAPIDDRALDAGIPQVRGQAEEAEGGCGLCGVLARVDPRIDKTDPQIAFPQTLKESVLASSFLP